MRKGHITTKRRCRNTFEVVILRGGEGKWSPYLRGLDDADLVVWMGVSYSVVAQTLLDGIFDGKEQYGPHRGISHVASA